MYKMSDTASLLLFHSNLSARHVLPIFIHYQQPDVSGLADC